MAAQRTRSAASRGAIDERPGLGRVKQRGDELVLVGAAPARGEHAHEPAVPLLERHASPSSVRRPSCLRAAETLTSMSSTPRRSTSSPPSVMR